MLKIPSILAVAVIGLGLAASPVLAADAGETSIEKQHWSFSGPFGTFDPNQLQRGFQVFKEVCSSCHGANLLAFRNLSEPGGPGYTEAQVKALAATYEIADPTADGGKRAGAASDHWPAPFATEQDARDANGGSLPPDMSVLAKARGFEQPFPDWVFNYFTAYAEAGPDYIHALLTNYEDEPPAGFDLPEGKHYNHVFPGHAIAMPPPLSDGQVEYAAAENGATVPDTVDQYSKDVSAFLMWVAEPHMDEHKSTGFRVVLFLLVLAGMMYFVKRSIWRKVH
jgi:ubiquinol-cytochrome c reductase cytochrome c1 subunit